jgi:methanogenic corrinoid protein MtbC1
MGIQMAAIACHLAGAQAVVLGVQNPVNEIVEAVREVRAAAVGLSVSLATGGVQTDRVLGDIRDNLPSDIMLIVGGKGARQVRRGPRGVRYATTMEEFSACVSELKNERSSSTSA